MCLPLRIWASALPHIWSDWQGGRGLGGDAGVQSLTAEHVGPEVSTISECVGIGTTWSRCTAADRETSPSVLDESITLRRANNHSLASHWGDSLVPRWPFQNILPTHGYSRRDIDLRRNRALEKKKSGIQDKIRCPSHWSVRTSSCWLKYLSWVADCSQREIPAGVQPSRITCYFLLISLTVVVVSRVISINVPSGFRVPRWFQSSRDSPRATERRRAPQRRSPAGVRTLLGGPCRCRKGSSGKFKQSFPLSWICCLCVQISWMK